MQIEGLWQRDSVQSDVVRPVIPAKLLVQGQELPITLLVDTGADRTVIGSAFARLLADMQQESAESLIGAGGAVDCFFATIRLELRDVGNRPIRFSITCAVLTDPMQGNEHLLGRDLLDYFALLCDRENNRVTLLRPPHHYSIQG